MSHDRVPRDPRLPGDERDTRDPRLPGDERDARDLWSEGDPQDISEVHKPRRKFWMTVAGFIVSFLVAVSIIWYVASELVARQDALCQSAIENRRAAILDAKGEAETLILVAIRNAEQDGHMQRARELRETVGPAYVQAQTQAAIDRRPEVDCL